MATAAGSFKVLSGSEDVYDELDGGVRLTHATGRQAFSGDIDADGSVHWLMLYRGDRTAQFVGLQRITGSVGGHRGSLVMAAEGSHDGTSSRITLTVIDGSGTNDLTGIRGNGRLDAPGGPEGRYELEYDLPS